MSFSILINGATSLFFIPVMGLGKGCPLSPLILYLMAEGLSRIIKEVVKHGSFKWICIGPTCDITHLFFVDDIMIFCEGTRRMVEKLKTFESYFANLLI
jgi:hypothetical protein